MCMFHYSFDKNHGYPYYEPTIVVHDYIYIYISLYLVLYNTKCLSNFDALHETTYIIAPTYIKSYLWITSFLQYSI